MGKTRKVRKRSARERELNDEAVYHLTSGDLSRILHVDLKTIHNWVNRGHISGRRTKGRHLRFRRTEVVRFMRLFGYPIPSFVGEAAPRAVLLRSKLKGRYRKLRGVDGIPCTNLFEAVLNVATGDQEILVLDLDGHQPELVTELLSALREDPGTGSMVFVGLSHKPSRRRAFLEDGGDVCLAAQDESDLPAMLRWLVGSIASQPASAQLREA